MVLSNFTYLNEGTFPLEEIFVCPQNDDRVYLLHDNANNITVYTGANKSGVNLTSNIIIGNDEQRPYRQYIKLDLQTRTTYANTNLYLNYTSTGDQVDDQLIQELRDEIVRLSTIIDNSNSTVTLSIQSTLPADESTDGGSTAKFIANKWLKKSQTNKIKGFPTLNDRVNGTNEVSATVTMTGDDEYTWQATSSLSPSTQYFFRVYNGLTAIDGTQLESHYDWSFQTAGNQAPTLSVSVSGNTTLGSQLTASTTIGTDPEGDTVQSTTWRWLRDGVAISGATSNTYTLVEADLGKLITAEATVTMTTGASPAPTQSSGLNIPIPNPPAILVSAGNTQNTISFTQNSTLATETYNLYWSTTTGVTKLNGTKITGVTSPHNHTSLTNGTPYYYVLTMVINGVESNESTQVNATPQDNVAPTSTISVTSPSTTSVSLSGTISGISANDKIREIQVALCSTAGEQSNPTTVPAERQFTIPLTAVSGSNYTHTKSGLNLVAGTTYTPTIRVEEVDINAPNVVTGLTATPGNNKVDLSWTAVSGATGYKVYRSTSSDSGFALLSSPTGTTHSDTTAVNGTTYYYKVCAVNSYDDGLYSDVSSGVTPTSSITINETFTGTNGSALDSEKWSTALIASPIAGSGIDIYNNQMRHKCGTTASSAVQSNFKTAFNFTQENTIKWKMLCKTGVLTELCLTPNIPVASNSAENDFFKVLALGYNGTLSIVLDKKVNGVRTNNISPTNQPDSTSSVNAGVVLNLEAVITSSSIIVKRDGVAIITIPSGLGLAFTQGYTSLKTVTDTASTTAVSNTLYETAFDDLYFVNP